jgi:RNA polymerase sigma factor (sigma-70 family)
LNSVPQYRLDIIASLARQMAFAPLEVRDRQLVAAESLAISLEPSKAYPPDYIIFRITGYNPKQLDAELLTGLALQHDLGVLIEEVSDTLDQRTIDRSEPVLTIDDLTEKFNVTSKTIQRWRRRGLAARRFLFPDGKRRVGFRLAVVEQFLSAHRDQVQRGANFSLVEQDEHQQILARARRLAVDCGCSPDEIARRIARKLNRSPLTIQATLRKHDAENPNDAILPLAAEPISATDRQKIVRIVRAGGSVRQAARRVRRPRTAVYRVIVEDRVERITKRRIKFHDDPLYHQDDAGELLADLSRSEALAAPSTVESSRIPGDLPAYLRDLYRTPLLTPARERALFLRFNYHKFQFVQSRRRLDPAKARARELDHLDRLHKRAVEVKNDIIRANLRLVVSVARKHLRAGVSLMELISEGNLTLMRAVESFDVHKGNKFSTYATLALMKGYARSVPQLLSTSRSAAAGEALAGVADRGRTPVEEAAVRDQVHSLLSRLDDHERSALCARFGLADAGTSDLAPHQARRLERSALDKLRTWTQQSIT